MGDPEEQQGPAPDAGGAGEEQPTQEELRRRLEEQLKKVRVQDMLLESVASILNLSARRIAKEDERDLEQARVGIDAVRALVEMLDPEPRAQVQNALSEVQVLYVREAGGAGAQGGEDQRVTRADESAGSPRPPGESGRGSGLWTPPGSS
jgi:hypothetical protein